jgi:hypothetical protein
MASSLHGGEREEEPHFTRFHTCLTEQQRNENSDQNPCDGNNAFPLHGSQRARRSGKPGD